MLWLSCFEVIGLCDYILCDLYYLLVLVIFLNFFSNMLYDFLINGIISFIFFVLNEGVRMFWICFYVLLWVEKMFVFIGGGGSGIIWLWNDENFLIIIVFNIFGFVMIREGFLLREMVKIFLYSFMKLNIIRWILLYLCILRKFLIKGSGFGFGMFSCFSVLKLFILY